MTLIEWHDILPKQPSRRARLQELLHRIPKGTVCTETNCCGGYLTQDEAEELERLVRGQD